MNNILSIGLTLFVLLLLSATVLAATQPKEIPLWPTDAPGSEGKTGEEKIRVTPDGEHVVSSVHKPSITPYLPPKEKATGAAVIVVPGGGHRELWVDHEGHNVARWLVARGIAAFVLKYRLAREADSIYKVDEHALVDTQRAIRLVRSRAQEWGIAPSRIGVLGFSAGGELAALSGMRFDNGIKDAPDTVERESCRPDFQALIYPGSSSRITVTKDSPPAFLVCGYKDRPDISPGLAEVYLKFKEAGVPAELHIYSSAGLGFFLAIAFIFLKGWYIVAPNLVVLGQYFVGFSPRWAGAFIGTVEAGVLGFVLGLLAAGLRNWGLAAYAALLKRRAEAQSQRDILD
jgi:dienelactone hydrolase